MDLIFVSVSEQIGEKGDEENVLVWILKKGDNKTAPSGYVKRFRVCNIAFHLFH